MIKMSALFNGFLLLKIGVIIKHILKQRKDDLSYVLNMNLVIIFYVDFQEIETESDCS